MRRFRDIGAVQYEVYISHASLLDGQKIQDALNKRAADILKRHGVRRRKQVTIGQGGDFWGLYEIVKKLFEYKEYLSAILLAFKWSLSALRYKIFKHNPKQLDYSTPRATINLIIRADEFGQGVITNLARELDTRDRITQLLLIGHAIRGELRNDYSIYRYDISVMFIVEKYRYKACFEISDELNDDFSIKRLLRQAQSLRVRPNNSVSFCLTNMLNSVWIKRMSSPYDVNGFTTLAYLIRRTYYSYYSTKMIRDYFK